MSVKSETPLSSSDTVRVTTKLPGLQQLDVRAFLCWCRHAEKMYGFRFDPSDPRRLEVRRWIDEYLEIV
jgi:hypothetical protein